MAKGHTGQPVGLLSIELRVYVENANRAGIGTVKFLEDRDSKKHQCSVFRLGFLSHAEPVSVVSGANRKSAF